MVSNKPMLLKLQFPRKCAICHRIFKYKHTCFGKSHRPQRPQRPNASLPRAPGNPSNSSNPITEEEPITPIDLKTYSLFQSIPFAVAPWLSRNVPVGLEAFVLSYFKERQISNPSLRDDVHSLVAASKEKCWNMSDCETILEMAQHLAKNCHSLQVQAKVTYRLSVVTRLSGKINGSLQIIEDFLCGLQDESIDLHIASLFISQASNYFYQFNFSTAHEHMKKLLHIQHVPEGQEQLLWDQIFCIGRILRGEGRFMEAKLCFETCMGSPGLGDSKIFLLKSTLADLFCEINYSQEPGNSYLIRAVEMVESDIERLRKTSRQHLKGYRRMLLSFIEVQIRQGHFLEAGDGVKELLALYDDLVDIDIVDRLGHVRTLIASARLPSSVQDSLLRWSDVLAWNKYYNPLEDEVFTCCVAYHAISNAFNALGMVNESSENFCRAMEVSRRRCRQFLIPGVGTYIYDRVLQISAHSPE